MIFEDLRRRREPAADLPETPERAPTEEAAFPERRRAEERPTSDEKEIVRVTRDDIPDLPKIYGFYVVDPAADPSTSFIEEGTGKRLRAATAEENTERIRRQTSGEGGDTRPYQKEPPPESTQLEPSHPELNTPEPTTAPTSGSTAAEFDSRTWAPEREKKNGVIRKTLKGVGARIRSRADELAAAAEPARPEPPPRSREPEPPPRQREPLASEPPPRARADAPRPADQAAEPASTRPEELDFNRFKIDWEDGEARPGLGRRRATSKKIITHLDYPGIRFSPEEYVRQKKLFYERGGLSAEVPPPPGRGRRGSLEGRVIGDRPPEERGPDWRKLDERRYVGVTVKPIREVLANERDARFFGEVLRSVDPDFGKGVLERYNNGTATKEDMNFMTFGAHEYALRLKFAEETNRMLKKEDVELLSRRSNDVHNLIAHEGEERGTQMVHNAIFHMAMRDPNAVEEMRDVLKQIGRDRETSRYKQAERRIDALCTRVGVRRRDYNSVFNLGSSALDFAARRATSEDLTKRYHDSAGKFRRAIDWLQTNPDFKFGKAIAPLPGSSRFAAVRDMATADVIGNDATYHMSLSNALRRIDDNLKNIARHIGPTVSDPDILRLIQQEALTNQNQTLAIERGPQTFGQVQQLNKERFAQSSIETRIRERMAKPDWPRDNPVEQDTILRDMARTERREQSGGGFFAWLFSILFDKNWSKAANKATGRPVHA